MSHLNFHFNHNSQLNGYKRIIGIPTLFTTTPSRMTITAKSPVVLVCFVLGKTDPGNVPYEERSIVALSYDSGDMETVLLWPLLLFLLFIHDYSISVDILRTGTYLPRKLSLFSATLFMPLPSCFLIVPLLICC